MNYDTFSKLFTTCEGKTYFSILFLKSNTKCFKKTKTKLRAPFLKSILEKYWKQQHFFWSVYINRNRSTPQVSNTWPKWLVLFQTISMTDAVSILLIRTSTMFTLQHQFHQHRKMKSTIHAHAAKQLWNMNIV